MVEETRPWCRWRGLSWREGAQLTKSPRWLSKHLAAPSCLWEPGSARPQDAASPRSTGEDLLRGWVLRGFPCPLCSRCYGCTCAFTANGHSKSPLQVLQQSEQGLFRAALPGQCQPKVSNTGVSFCSVFPVTSRCFSLCPLLLPSCFLLGWYTKRVNLSKPWKNASSVSWIWPYRTAFKCGLRWFDYDNYLNMMLFSHGHYNFRPVTQSLLISLTNSLGQALVWVRSWEVIYFHSVI